MYNNGEDDCVVMTASFVKNLRIFNFKGSYYSYTFDVHQMTLTN